MEWILWTYLGGLIPSLCFWKAVDETMMAKEIYGIGGLFPVLFMGLIWPLSIGAVLILSLIR